MRNAATHLSCADDAYFFDLHFNLPIDWSGHVRPSLLVQRSFELRECLEEVADEPVIGDAENRRAFVLVDGNDNLGILHARKMLYRSRYADGDVKFRGNDLACLANLPVIGHKARVDGGA